MQHIKKLYIALSIGLLVTIMYMVIQLIQTGDTAKAYKNDYAQLHGVQYGLFNSSIWATKIAHVIDQKIDEFDFTVSNREEIKKYVETILDTLIVEADRAIRKRNKKKKSFFDGLLGSTKQLITDSLIDIKDLRKKVPEFTDTIMNELERPSNQKLIKDAIRAKLNEFTKGNLTDMDMSGYNNVLKHYNTTDPETCEKILDSHLAQIAEEMNQATIIILLLTVMLLLAVVLQGAVLKSISLLLLSLTSLTLLIPGIMLPMLDIEAKISKLIFTILDKHIIFHNQILFFQSKSISDLVTLLFESGEAKMIFVGVLLTTFSIIFPVSKLVSTYIYHYSAQVIQNNKIIRFFALYSTKWSMADVMVVSIFMAYLGLDGVIDNELKLLEAASDPINIITTNGTQIGIGFFLFLGFVVTSFVLSTLVKKKDEDTHLIFK